MTRMTSSLNRKEMFSASIVIFMGLYYIIVFISSFVQARPLNMFTYHFWMELKWFLAGLLFASGGILMFIKKNPGWVITTATLLNFVVIVLVNIISLSQIVKLNAYMAITIGFFVMLVMAFLFLFSRATRLKFMVNNKSYLLTIALYLLMITVTFWT